MRRRDLVTFMGIAALGAAAAFGVASCGEDRGSVEVQGGTGATAGTAPPATATATAP